MPHLEVPNQGGVFLAEDPPAESQGPGCPSQRGTARIARKSVFTGVARDEGVAIQGVCEFPFPYLDEEGVVV